MLWIPHWRCFGSVETRSAVRRYRVQRSEADTVISDEHTAMQPPVVHRCQLMHESVDISEPRPLKRTP